MLSFRKNRTKPISPRDKSVFSPEITEDSFGGVPFWVARKEIASDVWLMVVLGNTSTIREGEPHV